MYCPFSNSGKCRVKCVFRVKVKRKPFCLIQQALFKYLEYPIDINGDIRFNS